VISLTIWKCGGCGTEYKFEDWIKLEKVVLVETDKNPSEQHGFTAKCSCGYVFGRDRYFKQTYHTLPLGEEKSLHIRISTVFLEMEHLGGYYYETMIFKVDDKTANDDPYRLKCEFQKRYKTQAEADRGHDKIIQMLYDGKYNLVTSETELIIEDFELEPPEPKNRFDVLDV